MMSDNPVFLFLFALSALLMVQCHQGTTQEDINKIMFNYTAVDNTGLKHEGVNVDYEFCIPANDASAKRVLHIEPRANIMKKSKGRSACSDREWLCIVSNHEEGWKKKLFAMASLPFVRQINETFYE